MKEKKTTLTEKFQNINEENPYMSHTNIYVTAHFPDMLQAFRSKNDDLPLII